MFVISVCLCGWIGYACMNSRKLVRLRIKIMSVIVGGTVGCVGMFVFVMIVQQIVVEDNNLAEGMQLSEKYMYDLTTLVNSSHAEGNGAFLSSNSFRDKEYYEYYKLLPDGGKRFGRVRATEVVLYEDDRSDAYMAMLKGKAVFSKWTRAIFIPQFFVRTEKLDKYAIHVPMGTVVSKFSVEL